MSNDLSNAMADMVSRMKAKKGDFSKTTYTTEEKIAERDAMMAKRIEALNGQIPPQLTGWCDLDEKRAQQRASHG